MQVVWLKRDLRIDDHRPLAEACAAARGGGPPVLCLFVFEPSYWAAPEHDPSHLVFARDSLARLDDALRARGGRLTVRVGELPAVLAALHAERPIATLRSHAETGGRLTFDRDLRVGAWCREHGVRWVERRQDGVVRRLRSRDGWAERWKRRMARPLVPAPDHVPAVADIPPGQLPRLDDLGLPPSDRVDPQPGGEPHGLATLESFLGGRGVGYRRDMSSPVTAWEGSSRLSPYLAWGNVSMRRVVQETARRAARLRADRLPRARGARDDHGRFLRSLASFRSRLAWHCHFMQKLEDEPAIEHRNMSRAVDGLREDAFDEARFAAWAEGRTGYPMIDACMRCLRETGWINFRMRGMLVSFAAYDLWLHWRRPGLHLAGLFLDYEPGIHWSQMQMQSGTTGVNALRIYSPTKQALDHDPDGVFIRRWVPELAGVPRGHLVEPWKMGPLEQRAAGFRVGRDYPAPIVDHAATVRLAKRRFAAVRGRPDARAEAARVQRRHGSRRGATARPRRRPG